MEQQEQYHLQKRTAFNLALINRAMVDTTSTEVLGLGVEALKIIREQLGIDATELQEAIKELEGV